MNPYTLRQGQLHCEGVPLLRIAKRVGTPFYVYSAGSIQTRFRLIQRAFQSIDPMICYSVKANGNLSILRMLVKEGSSFDIVSEGELYRAQKAGAKGKQIVFAGVGKTEEEIRAGLRAGVFAFNVESEDELLSIHRLAMRLKKKGRVAIRVNPDVDPKTHRFITTGKEENKFGVDMLQARNIIRKARRLRGVQLLGLHVHIGSQVMSPRPFFQALSRLRPLFSEFPGGKPEIIDLGGGFGISYEGEKGLNVSALAKKIIPKIKQIGCRLLLEPGRFIVGHSGALVTQVLVTKKIRSPNLCRCRRRHE